MELEPPSVLPRGAWMRRTPVVERLDEAGREMDEGVPVAGAGLQDEHGRGAILAEAVGQHTAGRTGADDHVVEGFHPRLSCYWIAMSAFGTEPRLMASGEARA